MLQASRHLFGKGREHHDRHVGIHSLNGFGSDESLADIHAGHGNDEVEILLFHGRQSLVYTGHTRDPRGRGEVQRHILVVELFVDAAILLHHEGIVGRGHQKHVENAPLHQILKGCVADI